MGAAEELAEVERSVVGKTAVSVVTELAVCAALPQPAFECLTVEPSGAFVMRCGLGGLSGQGRARTKKAAKHIAAQAVLFQILAAPEQRAKFHLLEGVGMKRATKLIGDLYRAEEEAPAAAPADLAAPADPPAPVKTPIQLLSEFVSKQGWNAAIDYQGVEERINDDKSKTFVVKASLGRFSELAEGRRIKDAKQAAARRLLDHLEAQPGLSQAIIDGDDVSDTQPYPTKDVPGAPRLKELDFSSLSARLTRLGRSSAEVRRLSELFGLDWTGLEEDEDAQKILMRLCENEANGFDRSSPTYVVLPEPSSKGEVQALCAVEVENPRANVGQRVETTVGTGLDQGRAVSNAALQMLQILTLSEEPLRPLGETEAEGEGDEEAALPCDKDVEDSDAARLQVTANIPKGPAPTNAPASPDTKTQS